MSFSYSSQSTGHTFPHGYPDHIHSALYSSPNVDDQGQQDDANILLTTPDGLDLPFSDDKFAQYSGPLFQGFATGRQPKGPWDPVAATGVPTPTSARRQNSRPQAHLSSQNQDQASFGSPSRRTVSDEGYHTLPSSHTRQDANFTDNETIGTAESLQELFGAGFDLHSTYTPSISGSNEPGQDPTSHDQAGDMPRNFPAQQATQPAQDEPLTCTYDCEKTFQTQSQLK